MILMGLVPLIFIAFFAELVDSSLGMGYGTTLTPILLIMGFDPLIIVPSVLLSEFATGLFAGFTHHKVGNVNLMPKTLHPKRIIKALKEKGVVYCFNRGIPTHLKLGLMFASCSLIGVLSAVCTKCFKICFKDLYWNNGTFYRYIYIIYKE